MKKRKELKIDLIGKQFVQNFFIRINKDYLRPNISKSELTLNTDFAGSVESSSITFC